MDINDCLSVSCGNGESYGSFNNFSMDKQSSTSEYFVPLTDIILIFTFCYSGTCIDHVNNYSCICNVGFTGRHCDIIITECSNTSCYPNVPCTENDFTISCGFCPSGFTGDGKNCKGRILLNRYQ